MLEEDRCTCCRWLYKLQGECLVIITTLLHVLLSAIEILIHLEIIKDSDQTVTVKTTTPPPPSSTSATNSTPVASSLGPHDPGGSCSLNLHGDLALTVQIIRYSTLVISALFFIEIIGRITYKKTSFFKDPWQIFDTFIVLLSLGAEIALYIGHEDLLCYHVATEAAAFIAIFRLWRIPRTCDIRKKEYKRRLQDQIFYLTKTKTDKEKECDRLETLNHNQAKDIHDLRQILKHNSIEIRNSGGTIPNGTTPNGIATEVTNRLFKYEDPPDAPSNANVDLERNDSDKNSKGNDSGIEVKDSFRSDVDVTDSPHRTTVALKRSVKAKPAAAAVADDEVFDSDGSELPVERTTQVQEVEVQIEEPSRQKQLPSITSSAYDEAITEPVQMRRKSSFEGTFFVNRAYDEDDEDEVDLDESRTYKSAEGIPMTDL